MKCWIVSQGWYEDFTILAVFESEQDANLYAEPHLNERYGWNRTKVQEFPFYPTGAQPT